MIVDDCIGRLSFPYQRSDDSCHIFGLVLRHVDPLTGIDKSFLILCLGCRGEILILVKPAVYEVGAAIAGSGAPVPSGTVEGIIIRAGGFAVPAVLAMPVVVTLQRHMALVSQNTMKLDFLSDS